jgi:uncharacterized SAM-binding protein YcdF (DUF218 family)
MLYFLKFIYGVLLFPPGLFILGLLAALWRSWRRQRQLAKTVLVITLLLYLASTGLVSNAVINSLEKRYTPPAAVGGDVIIMLGGGATQDTPNISGSGHVSGYAANRLLTTVQLYRKLGVPIIVSGGKVFKTNGVEAEISRDILVSLGVPIDKIIVENASLNTTENAQFSTALVRSHGFRQPILVTSAFHMDRAVLQFTKAGLAVVPFPTDYLTNVANEFYFTDLWPTAAAMTQLVLGLKEYLGIAVARWY